MAESPCTRGAVKSLFLWREGVTHLCPRIIARHTVAIQGLIRSIATIQIILLAFLSVDPEV